jgi:TetR/AcrR family transcriptional regulator
VSDTIQATTSSGSKPVTERTGRGVAHSREQTMALIHRAAIEVFAQHGLSGASTQAIAEQAGMSKARLHYYIGSKENLYRQVLQDIVDDWIKVFGFADEAFGPRKVLGDYIRRKLVFSFEHPLRSRIFAAEIMRGAPQLRSMLDHSKRRTDQAGAVIRTWIEQGLLDPIDPMLLMFNIWAVTQFYADHANQVRYFSETAWDDARSRESLIAQTTAFILKGAGVK